MPESRPPIDLHGISLAELQKLIDERAPAAGRPMESRTLRRFRACASPATAPGITRARRSAGPRWSGCSRPCCGASPTAATCSSRRSRSSTSRSKRPHSAQSRCRSKARAADRRIAFALDSGDAVDPRRRASLADRRHRPGAVAAPPRPPRPRGRAVAAALLRACRARARRRPRRAGIWSGGTFFPLGPAA